MSTTLDAVRAYIGRGWAPVPIPFREKGPQIRDWQNLRITADDAASYFNGARNVGIILGQASGGLTDLDLDSPEAIAAAPYLLPRTAVFGHESKRASHWVYHTDLTERHDRAAIKFLCSDKSGLLEVRTGAGGAAQTIFPPSTHVSGEPIEWTEERDVAEVRGDDLLKAAGRLAAASELARHYPKVGGRHDGAFVLGGFLARCGFSQAEAAVFAEAVGAASLQPGDKRRDMGRTARDGATAAKKAGFPVLAETFGAEVAKKVAGWLGYAGEQGASAEDAPTAEATAIVFTPTPFKPRDPTTFPRRQFVYGGQYARKYLSVTAAPTKVGKSSLGLVEAIAMATGRNLIGVQPTGAMRVWYWNGEDPREEIERRVLAICIHYDIDQDEIAKNLFLDSGRDTEIIIATQTRSGAVIATPVEEALAAALIAGEFDVFILDPAVSVHRVSENDNMAIDAVAKTFGRIADKTNVAIEAAHHTRKLGGATATIEDARGASAWSAAARGVRVLNRMTKEEGEKAGVEVGQERLYFRADAEGNMTPSTSADWYHLSSTGLGNFSGPSTNPHFSHFIASGCRIRQKLFCDNDLRRFGEAARCRRSVAQNQVFLDGSKDGLWWPSSMAGR